jgi:hypothetical protein
MKEYIVYSVLITAFVSFLVIAGPVLWWLVTRAKHKKAIRAEVTAEIELQKRMGLFPDHFHEQIPNRGFNAMLEEDRWNRKIGPPSVPQPVKAGPSRHY